MKWRLLCEIERLDKSYAAISLGPHRAVRCSCGGQVTDRPHALEYDGGACTHIVALYAMRVTEDGRESTVGSAQGLGMRNTIHHIRWTQLGRERFFHRYTAKALTQ